MSFGREKNLKLWQTSYSRFRHLDRKNFSIDQVQFFTQSCDRPATPVFDIWFEKISEFDQARALVHFARVLWLFLFELFFTPPPRKKELGGGVTFGLKRFLNFTNFERFLDTTSDKKTWRWCRKNMEVVSNPEILEILTYFSIFSSPNVTIPDHF